MILKYFDYISEKIIYNMILESKMVFSKNFIGLLSKMRSNKLAAQLLDLYSKDIPIQHNFIDITDEKDAVSFTPDRKVQELIAGRPEEWKIVDGGRFLTYNNRNDKIFATLGYERAEGKDRAPHPEVGTVGIIASEAVSPTSENIYVKFQYIDDDDGGTKFTVFNKQALELTDPTEDIKIWKSARNNIKIGRFVRSILTAVKIGFTDKEIENFTNQYKATFDFTKDLLKQFDIVQGDRIAHWYHYENYTKGGGTLNGSCMANSDPDFFEIYVKNPQISMVILYADGGVINDEKYIDSKIKGRAILWDVIINGKPEKFMDRIYTANDSDTELFKQFAIKNGWWFKRNQNMNPDEQITNGEISKKANIMVKLNHTEFEHYPYLDTMSYLDKEENILTNFRDRKKKNQITLKSTDGHWEEYQYDEGGYDDDDDGDDDDGDDDDDDDDDIPPVNHITGYTY